MSRGSAGALGTRAGTVMGMWKAVKNVFGLSRVPRSQDGPDVSFYRQWDQLRGEALTSRDRAEIDAIFYRHSAAERA